MMLLLVALSAHAHKVNMFAFAEGNEVFVEGYFTDGKKPRKCEVIVYDVSNKPLLTGTTNEDGQFSFTIPAPGDLRITLDAGEGHMAQYVLSAEETGITDSGTTGMPDQPPMAEQVDSSVNIATSVSSNKELQSVVQKSVGSAIRPVMRALDELKERRTMSDIIGGVGIIMGIGGLFLYFQARKLVSKSKS
jgi:nickel transport protein